MTSDVFILLFVSDEKFSFLKEMLPKINSFMGV